MRASDTQVISRQDIERMASNISRNKGVQEEEKRRSALYEKKEKAKMLMDTIQSINNDMILGNVSKSKGIDRNNRIREVLNSL